jgi:hypothetical protein
MNPRKTAAQFAAYTWYEQIRARKPACHEASRFARANWSAFLPVAHEGLGKLLLRIASRRVKRNRLKEHRLSRSLVLA